MYFDKAGLAISQESRFVSYWPVREKYEIKNGMLIGSGETKYYLPMANREIAEELANLHKKEETALLEFAYRFGHLGYSRLAPVDERTEGDPLKWIWTHANTANLVLQLVTSLREGDERAALQVIKSLKVDEDNIDGWDFEEIATVDVGLGSKIVRKGWALGDAAQGTSLELASKIVRTLLDENVKGITRKSFPTKDHQIQSFFRFDALIQVVYWQLFDAAEKGELRRCKQCQAPFIARDKRQRFCPKRFKEKESRCTRAYRAKRFREKKKAGA